MTIYVNREISGNGSEHFGGVQIQYLLCHLTTIGPDVFISDTTNIDVLIRAGWLSLGVAETYPDEVSRVFWTERIWINFADFAWHPRPTNWPGNPPDFTVWTSDVRWGLSPGTVGNLLVIGI
jgi:hypothetical protein